MKLNELRIGNLLYPIHLDGYAEVIEIMVSGIGIQKLGDNTQKSLVLTENIHRLEPIELTEEWFVKLRFPDAEINSSMVKFWNLGDISIWHEYYKHTIVDNKEWFFFVWGDGKKIRLRYVHELQNLYFALTNEELTFKNKS